jgi:hypothetical protein
MEALKHSSTLDGRCNHKLILIVMIIIFSASIGQGDVSISRALYTTSSECHEEVFLHNLDYSNTAGISNINYYANSQASTADQSETSRFINSVNINSLVGLQGANIEAKNSNNLEYSRSIGGGNSQLISYEYSLESGSLPASMRLNAFNPQINFNKDIYNLVNNHYEGKLQSFCPNFFVYAEGKPTGEGPSGFNDITTLRFGPNMCRLDTYLTDEGLSNPDYTWITSAGRGEIAKSSMWMQSNQNMTMKIKGTSSGPGSTLGDKSVPENGDIAQTAYMLYKLTSSNIFYESEK